MMGQIECKGVGSGVGAGSRKRALAMRTAHYVAGSVTPAGPTIPPMPLFCQLAFCLQILSNKVIKEIDNFNDEFLETLKMS